MKKWFLLYRIYVQCNRVTISQRIEHPVAVYPYGAHPSLSLVQNAAARAENALHGLIAYRIPVTRDTRHGLIFLIGAKTRHANAPKQRKDKNI